MRDMMTFKGYAASIHYSAEDEIFHGKIEGINDLVSFEGKSVKELTDAFHESVNEYIELCVREGKEPEKPYTGSFNVRIGQELHRQAAVVASRKGVSLNKLVQEAIKHEVAGTR